MTSGASWVRCRGAARNLGVFRGLLGEGLITGVRKGCFDAVWLHDPGIRGHARAIQGRVWSAFADASTGTRTSGP